MPKKRKRPFLRPGDRIWRPVVFLANRCMFVETPFKRIRKKGPYVIRAGTGERCGFRTKEWVVLNGVLDTGFKCFCFEPVPRDWIYFEVERIHPKGHSATVRPVVGEKMDVLNKYEPGPGHFKLVKHF